MCTPPHAVTHRSGCPGSGAYCPAPPGANARHLQNKKNERLEVPGLVLPRPIMKRLVRDVRRACSQFPKKDHLTDALPGVVPVAQRHCEGLERVHLLPHAAREDTNAHQAHIFLLVHVGKAEASSEKTEWVPLKPTHQTSCAALQVSCHPGRAGHWAGADDCPHGLGPWPVVRPPNTDAIIIGCVRKSSASSKCLYL